MSLLEVNGISRSFGGVHAVRNVTLSIEAGEVLALIGPNGAGKSTCFNMLNGQLRPDGGSIRYAGREMVGQKPRGFWRAGIGRTFQIAETYGSMTVIENVQMALLSHHRRLLQPWRWTGAMHREDALALLDLVGMRSQADRACSDLAYGDVKRVELVMALANEPRLLLMDEPTAGMAPAERNELMALTARLAKDRDMAVLFTEHSMDVVFAYATRVLVLSRGELIFAGDAQSVRSDPHVQEVYLGSSQFLELGNLEEVE